MILLLLSDNAVNCQIHRIGTNNIHKRNATVFDDEPGTTESHLVGLRETWMYAIPSAMLVGLSGIFPLLVIPLEAVPKLKDEGKSCSAICISFIITPFHLDPLKLFSFHQYFQSDTLLL